MKMSFSVYNSFKLTTVTFFSQVMFILSIVGTFLSIKCSFIDTQKKKVCLSLIHLEGTDYLLMEFLIKPFNLKPQTLNTQCHAQQ